MFVLYLFSRVYEQNQCTSATFYGEAQNETENRQRETVSNKLYVHYSDWLVKGSAKKARINNMIKTRYYAVYALENSPMSRDKLVAPLKSCLPRLSAHARLGFPVNWFSGFVPYFVSANTNE